MTNGKDGSVLDSELILKELKIYSIIKREYQLVNRH